MQQAAPVQEADIRNLRARLLVCAGTIMLVLPLDLAAQETRAAPGRSQVSRPGTDSAAVDVRRLRLESVLDLEPGWDLPLPPGDPWSPDGRFLALDHPVPGVPEGVVVDPMRPLPAYEQVYGVYVFDLNRPSDPPRRIVAQRIRYHVWSPDGKWIAFLLSSDPDRLDPPEMGSLVAFPVDGSQGVSLVEAARLGPFLWTRDGRMLFWLRPDGVGPGEEPPLPAPPPADQQRLHVTRFEWGDVRLVRSGTRQDPGDASPDRPAFETQREECLAGFYDLTRTPYRLLEDRGSGFVRLLAPVAGTPTGRSKWDQHESVLWSSVSPDLRYIIGFCTFIANDELEESPLYLAAPDSARADSLFESGRRIAGAGDGVWPRFSPREPLVVYEDPKTGRVHVDRLEVDRH